MAYAPIYDVLPDIGMRETRVITVMSNNPFNLPAGEYGLVEMFCNDKKCDCRRVIIMVMYSVTEKPVAYISFGWESVEYYAKWMNLGKKVDLSEMDAPDLRSAIEMHGAHLNTLSPQSEFALSILEMFKAIALNDKEYIERIKLHYKLLEARSMVFPKDKKAQIERKHSPKSQKPCKRNMMRSRL
jgi:hypothetical protein